MTTTVDQVIKWVRDKNAGITCYERKKPPHAVILVEEIDNLRKLVAARPALNIDTLDLMHEVERLIVEAKPFASEMGAVNWGDIGVKDIEYRLSMIYPDSGPYCIVTVEEASPQSALRAWIQDRLDKQRFPNVYIECEW